MQATQTHQVSIERKTPQSQDPNKEENITNATLKVAFPQELYAKFKAKCQEVNKEESKDVTKTQSVEHMGKRLSTQSIPQDHDNERQGII